MAIRAVLVRVPPPTSRSARCGFHVTDDLEQVAALLDVVGRAGLRRIGGAVEDVVVVEAADVHERGSIPPGPCRRAAPARRRRSPGRRPTTGRRHRRSRRCRRGRPPGRRSCPTALADARRCRPRGARRSARGGAERRGRTRRRRCRAHHGPRSGRRFIPAPSSVTDGADGVEEGADQRRDGVEGRLHLDVRPCPRRPGSVLLGVRHQFGRQRRAGAVGDRDRHRHVGLGFDVVLDRVAVVADAVVGPGRVEPPLDGDGTGRRQRPRGRRS